MNTKLSSDLQNLDKVFPFKIAQRRGEVLPHEKGKFHYVQSPDIQTKFSEPNNLVLSVSYHVVLNIPFYAGSEDSVSKVIKVFETTGFGGNRLEAYQKASESLVFVVVINMMESLEPDKNTKVGEKLDEPMDTVCEVHRFGFYWRPHWVNLEGQAAPFDRVRAKYLEIKKNNTVLAEHILKMRESSSIRMIPYREIREVIKQHVYTASLARIFRQNYPDKPAYLGLFDPDMISASYVFDTYADLIAKYQGEENAPVVLTTGYRVPILDAKCSDSPLYALAVELDMAVRHATAKFVKNGVYYPEPNTLVLLNADNSNESFMDGATLENPKKYTDSYEGPLFIESIIRERKINPQDCFIFDKSNPIITTMPDRMQYELGGKEPRKKIFQG